MDSTEWAGLVVRFCLATAAGDSLRTVYHDRIDGLLFPICELPLIDGRQERRP